MAAVERLLMHLDALLRPYVIVDIAGLALTLAGALVSARGAFLEDQDARKIAKTEGPHNHELEAAMKDQSRSAKYGFTLIAAGTLLQMVAVCLQVLL